MKKKSRESDGLNLQSTQPITLLQSLVAPLSADSNAGWKYLLTSITTEDYTDGGSG